MIIKNEDELLRIRESSKSLAKIFEEIGSIIKPGVYAKDIDAFVENFIEHENASSAFLGYGGRNPFPASCCVSINDELIHGIPGRKKLNDGDIVTIDIGVNKKGYFSDAARTYLVGECNVLKKRLKNVAERAFFVGIDKIKDGTRISDVSKEIQSVIESSGFHVVRNFVGHGVGKSLHEKPEVPNFYERRNTETFKEGMVVAIEPMVTCDSPEVYTERDGWTVKSRDGRPTSHYENTILILQSGCEILTKI